MWTEALQGKRAAEGGSASAQAGTRVNAEQASKSLLRRPTRRHAGEGYQRPETPPKIVANDTKPVASAGVVAPACARRGVEATREALSVARTRPPGTREGQLGLAGWRRGLEYRGSRVMPAEGRGLNSRGTSERGDRDHGDWREPPNSGHGSATPAGVACASEGSPELPRGAGAGGTGGGR